MYITIFLDIKAEVILNDKRTNYIIIKNDETKESLQQKCLKAFGLSMENVIQPIKIKMNGSDGDWYNIKDDDDIETIMDDYDDDDDDDDNDEPYNLKIKITVNIKKPIAPISPKNSNKKIMKDEDKEADIDAPKYLQPTLIMPNQIQLRWNAHGSYSNKNIIYFLKEYNHFKNNPFIWKGNTNTIQIAKTIKPGNTYQFSVYARIQSQNDEKNDGNASYATPDSKLLTVQTPSPSLIYIYDKLYIYYYFIIIIIIFKHRIKN